MPGFMVHLAATVLCSHGGQATPTAPNPRVLVSGQPIATQATLYVVAGCPFNVGVTLVPCVTGQWLIGATRVLANGVPVIVQASTSTCVPNGTPMVPMVTQTRVTAI
jgi:hypothetical protein